MATIENEQSQQRKVCPSCGRRLRIEQFYKNASRCDGHQSVCKNCQALMVAKHAKAHPELIQARNKAYREKKKAQQQ